MVDIVKYEDKLGSNYTRSFATTAVMNKNTFDNLVIDFYEEYVKPRLALEHTIEGSVFSHDENELIIIRDKQTSVTMSKETALRMANWIMENFEEDEEDEEVLFDEDDFLYDGEDEVS